MDKDDEERSNESLVWLRAKIDVHEEMDEMKQEHVRVGIDVCLLNIWFQDQFSPTGHHEVIAEDDAKGDADNLVLEEAAYHRYDDDAGATANWHQRGENMRTLFFLAFLVCS